MPNIHCFHVLGSAVTVQPASLDDSRKVIDMRYVIDRRHGEILTLPKDSGTTSFQTNHPKFTTFRPPFAIHSFLDYQDDHGLYRFSALGLPLPRIRIIRGIQTAKPPQD
jgi:hypothetical protein